MRAAAHEKLLVRAFLQRKLSHAFSREELDRLKQKGIYKEVEHQKIEAERLLVTRQVGVAVFLRVSAGRVLLLLGLLRPFLVAKSLQILSACSS